ncbi:MAG: septum formation initiator family protein [Actinobacteria bacterium]|nr:septum formation initiator family protein [Actinomycetota bacterium]
MREMKKGITIVDSLSRKAKINIFASIFLVFLVLIIFSSINPIMQIVENRKKISELEEKLNWLRNKNIELLALEKSLYTDEMVEIEARDQFNIAKEGEIIFRTVEDRKEDFETTKSDARKSIKDDLVYSNCDLWENIKILYNEKMKK